LRIVASACLHILPRTKPSATLATLHAIKNEKTDTLRFPEDDIRQRTRDIGDPAMQVVLFSAHSFDPLETIILGEFKTQIFQHVFSSLSIDLINCRLLFGTESALALVRGLIAKVSSLG